MDATLIQNNFTISTPLTLCSFSAGDSLKMYVFSSISNNRFERKSTFLHHSSRTTVLPVKSDSDSMFCLQVIYGFAIAQVVAQMISKQQSNQNSTIHIIVTYIY